MKCIEPKPCKACKIGKIKFDSNSYLVLDVFPSVFLVIRGFEPCLNLYIRIVLN